MSYSFPIRFLPTTPFQTATNKTFNPIQTIKNPVLNLKNPRTPIESNTQRWSSALQKCR